MNVTDVLRFAAANNHAVLHTTRRDGGAQLSPVTVGVDDRQRLVISSRETAIKVRNLRSSPRASLCVFTDRFFGPWVQAEGDAEILSLPEAMDPLVDYYRSVAGEHGDWDEYRAAMVQERRVLIRVAPDRVGPRSSG